jgi:hypothetical protein
VNNVEKRKKKEGNDDVEKKFFFMIVIIVLFSYSGANKYFSMFSAHLQEGQHRAPQRTSAHLSDRQRTSAHLSDRQRTSSLRRPATSTPQRPVEPHRSVVLNVTVTTVFL